MALQFNLFPTSHPNPNPRFLPKPHLSTPFLLKFDRRPLLSRQIRGGRQERSSSDSSKVSCFRVVCDVKSGEKEEVAKKIVFLKELCYKESEKSFFFWLIFPFFWVLVQDGSGSEVKEKSVSVILLAGGKGKRMGASMPKQYLPLLGQPIALYSFYTFSRIKEVKEIVVVCDPSYKSVFEDAQEGINVDVKFALPGKERQDSVYNGFQEIQANSELVCVHDSARPLISTEDVEKVLKDALLHGAAVLGVPAKATIKEADSRSFVVKTLDRKTLWEMQTPQVIKPDLLRNGFELVYREGLEVTDDVSIVEHLKRPVYITEGSYTNIKVTTPDDLLLAERILDLEEN